MANTTKTRSQLKAFFVKNAIPSEGNFADLVDAPLNQADDGIYRRPGEPLSVVAASDPNKQVLRLYPTKEAPNPDWLLSLNPTQDVVQDGKPVPVPVPPRPGFGIIDGGGNARLFIDKGNGNIGIGTNTPADKLTVAGGNLRVEGGLYRRITVASDTGWAGLDLVCRARDPNVYGNPHIDFTHGAVGVEAPDYGIRVHSVDNKVLHVTSSTGAATLQVKGTVKADGQLTVLGESMLQGKVTFQAVGTDPQWDKIIITTAKDWDGEKSLITAGPYLMLQRPHVPWSGTTKRAAIILGRAGGVPGGLYWDAGVDVDGNFSFVAVENKDANSTLALQVRPTGHAWIAKSLTVGNYLDRGPRMGAASMYSIEIGGDEPTLGSGRATIYLHHHYKCANQLRYYDGTLFLEAAGPETKWGTKVPDLNVAGNVIYGGVVKVSSLRIKENVRPASGCLDVVRRLTPVRYDLRERCDADKADVGFIAEEVGAVDPDLICKDAQEGAEFFAAGVRGDSILALAIGAIKELSRKVLRLESDIRGATAGVRPGDCDAVEILSQGVAKNKQGQDERYVAARFSANDAGLEICNVVRYLRVPAGRDIEELVASEFAAWKATLSSGQV